MIFRKFSKFIKFKIKQDEHIKNIENTQNVKDSRDIKKIKKIKKNNFLVIILFVLNIIFWNYYLIYNTNIYKNFFYDFNKGNTTSAEKGYLVINFFSDSNNKFIILHTPTNKTVIIDTGGDINSKKILNYMKAHNFVFIDTIFLTSSNENACKGLGEILNTFFVGEIVDGILHGNEKLKYIVSRHPEISYTKATSIAYQRYITK